MNDNKWANNNEDVVIQKSGTDIPLENTESNTSRNMGIAMGVVGVILVIAGVLPMFMGNSVDKLQGDSSVSATQSDSGNQEIDPLVALLSGDSSPSSSPTLVSPSSSPVLVSESPSSSSALVSPSPSPSPSETPSSTPVVESTPRVIASVDQTPVPSSTMHASASNSEVETILEKKNVHVGTVDTTGENFHNSAGLSNSSVSTSSKTDLPASTPKTGSEMSLLLLGFSFLFTAFFYARRRS